MDQAGEILDERALVVSQRLAASELMDDYYLAGGTALALQLRHRRSLDLDFFQKGTSETIAFPRLQKELARLFPEGEQKLVLKQVDQGNWELLGMKVAFLAYPFPLLYPLVSGERFSPRLKGIFLAEYREIAAMKAYALGRRATFRDYLDLYFLLRRGVRLAEIIEDASRKFVIAGETVFSPKLFLEQLSYTEDVEDEEAALSLLHSPGLAARQVQKYLRQEVAVFLEGDVLLKE